MNRKERRSAGKPEGVPKPVSDLFGIAVQHAEAQRLDAAIACFRKAVRLAPNLAAARYNLGMALAEQGDLAQAILSFRKTIALAPELSEAHSNLAAALTKLGQYDQAETSARNAIAAAPTSLLAHFNHGTVLEATRRLDGAAAAYQKAVDLKHDFAVAHVNLAMVHLANGNFDTGWREYEWRWQTPSMIAGARNYAQPQWRGQHADGQTLLLYAEQGFGDTLQFCRYAPLAAAAGLQVILQVQPPLVRLLRGMPGIDRVIADGDALPAFDFHCPLLSLPLAFGTTAETIPALPYLTADDVLREAWRDRISQTGASGLRVGVAWAGNAYSGLPVAAAVDLRRSIKPERLAPWLNIPGVTFFSLQKDHRPEPVFSVIDLMPQVTDFADTAALIANLDLVISVDTAVAHLAGAMGKPVWLLNRYASCWRWLDGRDDSPWYPSMRVFNQVQRDDWQPVVNCIATALGSRLNQVHQMTIAARAMVSA